MIKRHTIAALLATTALAYGICPPAQAAGFVEAARPVLPDPGPDDQDRSLRDAIRGALAADRSLSGCYVAVSAHAGRVTLGGVVQDASQLARILQTAASIPGVRAVDNGLELAGR